MGTQLKEKAPERIIGRYALYDEIASGGMAVVHIGRLLGQAGFSRTVAIKRLHPQFAKDPNFVSMFLDEARLSVRVQHPNVVAPLDVLVVQGEVLVVMEYVAGDTLARLQRSPANQEHPPDPAVVVGVLCDALYGLHAAHEALGENGQPLHIVHRDVTPQNIMVGIDGIARVLDFGVAKAAMRSQCTMDGTVKGKIAYMSPEQVEAKELDRRTDIFAAGVVAWEALSGNRLFFAEQPGQSVAKILQAKVEPPSKYRKEISAQIDAVVLKALKRDPRDRFQTAREFAVELERACAPATPSAIADWVRSVGGAALSSLAERVAAIEAKSSGSMIRPVLPPPAPTGLVPPRVAPPPMKSSPRIPLDSRPRITVPLIDVARGLDLADQIPTVRPPDVARKPLPAAAPASRMSRRAVALGIGVTLVFGLLLVGLLWRARSRANQGTAGTTISNALLAPRSGAPVGTPVTKPVMTHAEPMGAPPIAPAIPAAAKEVAPLTSVPSATAKKNDRNRQSNPAPTTKSPPRATAHEATKTGGQAKTGVDCAPPYYVDSKGIRRLKPECM